MRNISILHIVFDKMMVEWKIANSDQSLDIVFLALE